MKTWQAILFDLDGTLLPMDMDIFTHAYFGLLAQTVAPLGYEKDNLIKSVWAGTEAMIKNNGSALNKDVFWQHFAKLQGEGVYQHISAFDQFYSNEFNQAAEFCSPRPELAQKAVKLAHELADRVILATNPLFPAVGVQTRLSWIGLQPSDFDYITSYENSRFCKPSFGYYQQIVETYGLNASCCLMVGNDIDEDVRAAEEVGMQSFLLTDCLINKSGVELPEDMHGSFEELIKFFEMYK